MRENSELTWLYPFKKRGIISELRAQQVWRGVVTAIIFLLVIGYAWWGSHPIRVGPELELNPVENTQESLAVISGSTKRAQSLWVNHRPVQLMRSGQFSYNFGLSPGINFVTVTAQDRLNKQTTQTLTISVPFQKSELFSLRTVTNRYEEVQRVEDYVQTVRRKITSEELLASLQEDENSETEDDDENSFVGDSSDTELSESEDLEP